MTESTPRRTDGRSVERQLAAARGRPLPPAPPKSSLGRTVSGVGGNKRSARARRVDGTSLPWDRDDYIVARCRVVQRWYADGFTSAETAEEVNVWIVEHWNREHPHQPQPPIGWRTVLEDLRRARELDKREIVSDVRGARREAIANFRRTKRKANLAMAGATPSQRAQLLHVVAKCDEEIAKLSGAYTIKIEIAPQADLLRRLIEDAVPDVSSRRMLATRIAGGGLRVIEGEAREVGG